MFLGIARGQFYYDYYSFIVTLFEGTGIQVVDAPDNTDEILSLGNDHVVDEACMPMKLTAGQIRILMNECDAVLVPKLMKDINGRWYCPKQLGIAELICCGSPKEKIIGTDPLYMDHKKNVYEAFIKVMKHLGVDEKIFNRNFEKAYSELRRISCARAKMHMEAGWEFTPRPPKEGEIVLPNINKVFLAGHCYNVFDRFANNNIMKRLDDLCIETITENAVSYIDKAEAVEGLNLLKNPFWESVIRILGSAICLKDEVDGIIYLSSFSCGPDSLIIEMIKEYVHDLPMMVIKLDEHKGSAGFETRLEAFSDLLERRRAS